MRSLAFIVLLAGWVACPLPAPAQQMYKWVDEKGVTHFSETPPPADAKSVTKIEVKTPQPDRPATDNWREREQQSRQRRATQGIEEEKSRKQEEQQRPARCRDAQRRMDLLTNRAGLYRLDAKGERVFMEEKERAAEMETAKADLSRYCN